MGNTETINFFRHLTFPESFWCVCVCGGFTNKIGKLLIMVFEKSQNCKNAVYDDYFFGFTQEGNKRIIRKIIDEMAITNFRTYFKNVL